MSYYVYELIDPRDDVVFYVGKGKRGRIDQHEPEARKGRQSRKCARIREIEAAGLRIVKRKVSHHQDEMDAYQAEADLICEYGLANLTNVMLGGGGMSKGVSVYEDRRLVAAATKLVRRIHGRKLGLVRIAGHVLDMSFLPGMINGSIEKVASRRSLEWVNEIAAKYNVTYQPEPA